MKRYALLLACAMMVSSSGCCLFGMPGPLCGGWGGGGYGAGYPPTYGGYGGYGGGYGNCPNGACGQYPGAYMGGAPTAALPYGYPQTATIDPMPIY